jgi:hypothetical protein
MKEAPVKTMLTLVSAGLCAGFALSAPAAEYKHKIVQAGVTFEWGIDGQSLNGRMSAKTTGWVGVGFNATKDMKDAGFVIGAVKDGQAKAAVYVGTAPTAHSKAVVQADISNIGGGEADGVTTISFTIPLVSKNPQVKPIVPEKDTKVLLAYGEDDSVKVRHASRAEFLLNLSTGELKK